MTDLQVKDVSLKLAWLKRLLEQQGCWKDLLIKNVEDIDLEYFLHSNLSYKDYPFKLSENSIWVDVINYWCKFNYKNAVYSVIENQFLYSNIWHNSIIKVAKKTVFYKTWYNTGVKIIADLINFNTHKLYTYTQFTTKYDIKCM